MHTIEVVVDRLVIAAHEERRDGAGDPDRTRLVDSVETALKLGEGMAIVVRSSTAKSCIFSEHFACPDCGIEHRRDRAAHLLVQLPARRLPGLHRPGHRAWSSTPT